MATSTQRSREVQRIHNLLQASFTGQPWHGDSLMKILDGITAEQAARKPVPAAHSIWELVQHIAVWEGVARRRLSGEPVVVTPEQDWPAVHATDAAAWQRTLETLKSNHAALEQAIAGTTDDRLDEIVPGKDHSVFVLLHGVIEHAAYHAGQIALLKKAG
ncbi:MAG: DinB family protein [Acidobacteriaceae bacterium]|nr:DinB family protein [Acidobacteriaceae bacterium]